jgi:hypothetical protein
MKGIYIAGEDNILKGEIYDERTAIEKEKSKYGLNPFDSIHFALVTMRNFDFLRLYELTF